jgi:hypothetical protein
VGLLALAVLTAFPVIGAAEDISVQASVNRRKVPLNGQLELSLQVNGAQNVQPPNVQLEQFDVQYLGPSTQISVINGVMSSSIAHRYILSPKKEGVVTIGPLTIEVAGKTYETRPIEVEVLPPARVAQRGAPFGGLPQEEEPEPQPDIGDALQLQLGVDRTRAYLNQAIPIRLQLLVGQVAVRGIEMPRLRAEGFLIKPLGQPARSEVAVGGQPYTLLEFETVAIPLKAGQLSLGPADIECRLVQRRPARRRSVSPFGDEFFEDFFGGSLMDDFFGQAYTYPVTVHAEPVAIEVLPLPDEGKPSDFAGTMGRFRLEASVVPQEVAVGEPVTITMTIDGEGNYESVHPPTLAADTAQFKVYAPQAKNVGTDEASQRKMFEQVLIPLDPSVTEIPAVRFSFFDPTQGRYETITKGPFPLVVKPAPVQERPTIVTQPQRVAPLSEPEALGRDIIYIKERLGPLRPVGWTWYGSPWWWFWTLGALGFLMVSEGLRRRYRRLVTDPAAARASKAMKRAWKRLQQARLKQRGDVHACYEEVFKALQGYVGDRFNVPSAGLTKAELEQHLRPRGIQEELIRELSTCFDRCDAARFAPSAVAADQADATLQTAESLLKRLERRRPS